MRDSALLFFGAAIVAGFAFGACNCGDPEPILPEDAGVEYDGGYDGDYVETDGGPGSQCLPDGHPCSTGSGGVCCSGTCSSAGACAPSGTFCKGANETCTANLECCTNNCAGGTCANFGCKGTGDVCGAAGECCSGTCTNGACEALAGASCKVLGEGCAAGGDCCSTNCQGGVCVRAYTCMANNDICYGDDDCCGRACSKNDGTAGRCLIVGGGGGGGCNQSGNPCTGASNCCTRVCVDPGSGVTICQPATGCIMTGQYCDNTQACCGGGLKPQPDVACDVGTSRCDNGQSCNPVGNICGAKVLPDGGSVNASQNCCDGKTSVCKMDSSGIPRCFGGCPNDQCPQDCPTGYTGVAPCCIAAGEQCEFKDQCCNGAPCVPDTAGVLRCATASTCFGLGTACTPGASECCAGTVCLASEIGAACQLPPDPVDAGTLPDGGSVTVDAGPVCKPNTQTCSTSGECCSGICSGGVCEAPGQCQPQGEICTASADCCTGLACSVQSGQTTGTCQPSSCQAAGQTCSPTTACCTGLGCLTPAGSACTGTTACTCNVIIN